MCCFFIFVVFGQFFSFILVGCLASRAYCFKFLFHFSKFILLIRIILRLCASFFTFSKIFNGYQIQCAPYSSGISAANFYVTLGMIYLYLLQLFRGLYCFLSPTNNNNIYQLFQIFQGFYMPPLNEKPEGNLLEQRLSIAKNF